MIKMKAATAATLAFMSLALTPFADAEPMRIVTALATETPPQAQPAGLSRTHAEPYVLRSGQVRLNTSGLLPESMTSESSTPLALANQIAQTGQELILELFPGEEKTAVISSDRYPNPGTRALIGHLPNGPLASFSMTLDARHYLISLEDPTQARLYRISGDTRTGIGEIVEVDMMEASDIIYLPPLPSSDD